MRKIWHENAWEEYLAWQLQDIKTLKRINLLLQSIDRNGTAFSRGFIGGQWHAHDENMI